jgi:hypothetical protein
MDLADHRHAHIGIEAESALQPGSEAHGGQAGQGAHQASQHQSRAQGGGPGSGQGHHPQPVNARPGQGEEKQGGEQHEVHQAFQPHPEAIPQPTETPQGSPQKNQGKIGQQQ